MRKTLVTLLATLMITTGCTETGRAFVRSMGTHAVAEGVSAQLNPKGTNINIYNQAPRDAPNLRRIALTFGEWTDTNKDNIVNFDKEYVEIKNVFKEGEKINFFFIYGAPYDVSGKKETFRIYNENDGR